jgi:hypothetical protein
MYETCLSSGSGYILQIKGSHGNGKPTFYGCNIANSLKSWHLIRPDTNQLCGSDMLTTRLFSGNMAEVYTNFFVISAVLDLPHDTRLRGNE